MGKISSYGIDGTPSKNDKWVGTDGLTGQTKNFNAEGLANVFNYFGLIGLGGQIPFTFFSGDALVRPEGSISFPLGDGDLTAFSSVTSLVVSNKSSSGNLATEYINYLNAGNVLIYDLSNINNFAKFSVTSIVVRPLEPTFFNVSLTFVEGNGSFDQTRTYGLIESGAAISNHNSLQNIGTNTHVQIDTHIADTTNPHSVTKAQVGLSNADNTSDANKPVSTAAQTALDSKVDDAQVLTDVPLNALFTDTIYDSTAVDAHIADTTNPHSVTKTQVGLGDADNTSDVDKPVSTAAQAALDLKISLTEKGAPNGVAQLDGSGVVLLSQLPSYVDDVLEYADLASFPATGEAGKIYVATDTNKTYRWSGTVYVYITSGAVDSVAGKTGVVTLVKADVGLGNVDNTTDLLKPVSTAAQTALDGKVDDAQVLTNVPGGALFTDTTDHASFSNIGVKTHATLDSEVTANNAKVSNATHTGDVTGSGALTIADDVISYAKLGTEFTTAFTVTGTNLDFGAYQVFTRVLSGTEVLTITNAEIGVVKDLYMSGGTAFSITNGILLVGDYSVTATTNLIQIVARTSSSFYYTITPQP